MVPCLIDFIGNLMISDPEKSIYLGLMEKSIFESSDSNYNDELSALIRNVNIQDTLPHRETDEYLAAPIVYSGTKYTHPGLEGHPDLVVRNKYRPPVAVKSPNLIELFTDFHKRFSIYTRRKKSALALVRRMFWPCQNMADVSRIEPDVLRQFHLYEKSVFYIQERNSDYVPGIPTIPVTVVSEFQHRESEAIMSLKKHLLIEQLTQ